jgi:hypothetical protein
MSFGESIFFVEFIQKIAKEDQNIKRDRGITYHEYSGRFQRTPEDSTPRKGIRPCQVGSVGPTPVPPDPLWCEANTSFGSILPPPPRMHLSHT